MWYVIYEFLVWFFRLYVAIWATYRLGAMLGIGLYILWLKATNPRPIYLLKLRELKKWSDRKKREEKEARLDQNESPFVGNIGKIIGFIAWFLPL